MAREEEPTTNQPLHGEPRPKVLPVVAVVAMVVVVLAIFAVITWLEYHT